MINDGLWDAYKERPHGRLRRAVREGEGDHARAIRTRSRPSLTGARCAPQAEGKFRGEIVPVEIAQRKGPPTVVADDEEPGRGDVAKLGALRPAFQKDGTVTAGNASSINDGAAALVLAGADTAAARGWKPLARIVAVGRARPGARVVHDRAGGRDRARARARGWKTDDVDLWEINEAFAVVSIANNKLLGLDPARVNVWGGAVALGHPIGASRRARARDAAVGAARRAASGAASPRCASAAARASRSPSRWRSLMSASMSAPHPGSSTASPASASSAPARWGAASRSSRRRTGSRSRWPTRSATSPSAGARPIGQQLAKLVEKQKLTAADRERSSARIQPTDSTAAIWRRSTSSSRRRPRASTTKREIFEALDQACRGGVVLATNTSSISITAIGAAVTRPERVIGMHFMNPPPLMKLVEIIRGLATADATYETTRALAERLGKETVVSRDISGFIVNRVLMPMLNEACFALYEGIGSVDDLDKAIQLGLNHPMGPFALMDLIGLDTTLAILEVLHRDLGDPKYRPCPLLRQYVAAGWLGRKSGRGFHRYGAQRAADARGRCR